VKVPTGGKEVSSKPASAPQEIAAVSRSGAIPEPTVTVRMRENGKMEPRGSASAFAGAGSPLPIPVTLRKLVTERIDK
jgi:hypothetical protein